MTYKEALDWIKNKVSNDIDSMALKMSGEYELAYQETLSQIDRVYAKYLLTKDPADYYNIMIQYGRLDNLLIDIQKAYNNASKKVGKQIVNSSVFAMKNTYNLERYLMNWIVPEYGFSSLNESLIDLTVTGTQESWKAINKAIRDRYNISGFMPQYGTLSDLLFKNKKVELTNINQAITQSFIQGKSYKDASQNITELFDTSKFNAMRIAQTEGNRCGNAGGYANMIDAQNAGVEILKFWIATLDTRTRDRHQSLDNKYSPDNAIPIDEPFEISGYQALYPGGFGVASLDINCRCSTGTKINGKNPEYIRRGRNPVTGENEVFSFKNYDEWAEEYGIAA